MVIIGLTGYARTGKDTIADELVRKWGFTKVGFADALRQALYALNPIIYCDQHDVLRYADEIDQMGYENTKDTYPEVRRLLQRLGTEVGRRIIGEDVWVDLLMDRIMADFLSGKADRFVINDVRFDNEAQTVRAAGGRVVRVMRPGYGPVNDHASDNQQFIADYHVMNDDNPESISMLAELIVRRFDLVA